MGRLRSWAIMPLLAFCFSICMTAQNSTEANMSSDRVLRVKDPESNLEAGLSILRESDGGVSAVEVELRNPSDDHDVVLRVNTEKSAFIMLTVTDQQGVVLSEPSPMVNSAEAQRFATVRIARAASQRWRVPIAAQLEASAIPDQGLKGRLVINVALLFSKARGDEQPADADFKSSILTLYDMDVLFTRAALSASPSVSPNQTELQ